MQQRRQAPLLAPTSSTSRARARTRDNWYPYGGETHIPGYCNEGKGSMMPVYYGTDSSQWTYADFNDPRLNQIDGGLAPTASYPHCESPCGIYDCVGNLHEWGSDPADANGHGRFRGGFYGDAEINGHGCLYVTSAHELELPRLLDRLPLLRRPGAAARAVGEPRRRREGRLFFAPGQS